MARTLKSSNLTMCRQKQLLHFCRRLEISLKRIRLTGLYSCSVDVVVVVLLLLLLWSSFSVLVMVLLVVLVSAGAYAVEGGGGGPPNPAATLLWPRLKRSALSSPFFS